MLPFLKVIWESPGDVDGHGTHPEEESNEGVLDDVTKKNAKAWVQPLFISVEIQTAVDPHKEVAEKHIEKEPNSNLSKQIHPQVI